MKPYWQSNEHDISLWNCNGMAISDIGFNTWIPSVAYCKTGKSVYRNAQDAKRISIQAGKMPDHPSPKPIEYMLWQVGLWTEENGSVLDLFCGSGTTLVAAYRLGREAVGIEVNEDYCNATIERLEREFMQKRLITPVNSSPRTQAMDLR